MIRLFSLILLACLPFMTFAAGKIYTWQDENGNTVYGDRPPAEAEVTEIAIQGKKKAAVEVESDALTGEWFGAGDKGGEVKMSMRSAGNIVFTQTRSDQSVYNYQGVWTLEDTTLTVITEFTQEISSAGKISRSVEPVQLIYTIVDFDGANMEFIAGQERFTVGKL
ncbi:DUF4124 domain-containing protein [Reinekea marina]|uniref:DUF4124 domain-containing protein n=1 Tax=Reinekea marina TaxID=1310421 RepID=A0ABV7WQ35_9GAMM|nr:DUF4124 domain-containing protein [Reinekea marina]MDN3650373.1 DUF4124 domain-containing protein [Reinekea marina]